MVFVVESEDLREEAVSSFVVETKLSIGMSLESGDVLESEGPIQSWPCIYRIEQVDTGVSH